MHAIQVAVERLVQREDGPNIFANSSYSRTFVCKHCACWRKYQHPRLFGKNVSRSSGLNAPFFFIHILFSQQDLRQLVPIDYEIRIAKPEK